MEKQVKELTPDEKKLNQEEEKFKLLGMRDIDGFILDENANRNNIKMTFVSGGQGGGKIAAEFCRLGYPLVAYNTSKEDLDDLQKIVNEIPEDIRGSFETIYLPGEGGASKDRDLGYQAIKDNLDLLEEQMFENEHINDADFVWLVVTLGGGTGNGSLAFVSKILGLIREKKKIVRGGVAKASIGIIAAVPDSRKTKNKIAANVALAINEIQEMHDNLEIGAVVLVDNKKLTDDFNERYSNKETSKEWSVDGNAKVARIITETVALTSLPGSEVLDRSELLDMWSAPGYLNLGKKIIKKDWMEQYVNKGDNSPYGKNSKKNAINLNESDKEEVFAKLVKDSFEDNIFVSGIDLDAAIVGGMVVMTDGKVISTKDASSLELVMNEKILKGEAVETSYYGCLKNEDNIGTVYWPKESNKDQDGRIFTMCVTYTPPEYILDWVQTAAKKRQLNESTINKLSEKKNSLAEIVAGLDANSKVTKKNDIDIASSLSQLINSDRGTKSKTVESKGKRSLRSLLKEDDDKVQSETKAVDTKTELAARIREKMNKQN